MNRREIESLVIATLKEVQQLSGRAWADLKTDSKPIGELDGFDSLTALEATVLLEHKVGCHTVGQESLFVSKDGKQALSLKQICDLTAKLIKDNGDTSR